MPGPLPKPAHTRQRRNKSVSRLELEVSDDQRLSYVPLADLVQLDDVHPMTLDWWSRLWDSPQVSEFLEVDLGSLLRLAVLIDMFWKTGKLSVAREIRILERDFGLTPLSRRRLEWTVTTVNDSKAKLAGRVGRISNRPDPREALSE